MTFKLTPEEMEAFNADVRLLHAIKQDTPQKRWIDATARLDKDGQETFTPHPAIYRALKIDPQDPVSWYAVAMCRLMRVDGKPVIGVAWPCPTLDNLDPFAWLDIQEVIYWNPVDNTVMPNANGWAAWFSEADQNRDQGKIYADPFAWLRAWAEARAQWLVHRNLTIKNKWAAMPQEPDLCPGLLMTSDADKVAWPSYEMPRDLTVIGANPQNINKAILRAARLPMVRAAQVRKAA